jgi:hypothetical protein
MVQCEGSFQFMIRQSCCLVEIVLRMVVELVEQLKYYRKSLVICNCNASEFRIVYYLEVKIDR